jgi:hypothetical protein
VVIGDVSGDSRGDEGMDGMCLDVVKSNAWPVWSCSSWGEAEEWLEGSGRRRASGKALIHRFAVK